MADQRKCIYRADRYDPKICDDHKAYETEQSWLFRDIAQKNERKLGYEDQQACEDYRID